MMNRSFELDLVLGVANAMAANPNARVTLWSEYSADYDEARQEYVPNPPSPAGAVPILIDRYGGDGPHVVLTEYTVDDDPSLSEATVGLQATIRAEESVLVKAITSDLYDLLQGRWGGMLGRVSLVSARRTSGTNAGQDSNNRLARIENYYLRVHRPSTHRQ